MQYKIQVSEQIFSRRMTDTGKYTSTEMTDIDTGVTVHDHADHLSTIRESSDSQLPADGPSIESLSINPGSPKSIPETTILALPAPVKTSYTPGTIGLSNLGNTCFMNSVLQCLFHCRPLCEYFISGAYKSEINTTNVLGTGGKLVTEFARLIEKVWLDPTESVIAPRDLKYVIGQHAPMFMGYSQQDSQELVTFLLDGLHEDLNLVLNKPYTEAIEANGRPDQLVAQLSWDQHLLRNKSKIVDLFQGQYKSRLRCPNCSKPSVTFDPFMYLSLPIPSTPDLPILVTFTYAQQDPVRPPIRLAINVFRDTTDLPKAIAAAVVSELPEEYTADSIVVDEVLVFTQSNNYNSFQLLDSNASYMFSSISSRKKVFCTFPGNPTIVGPPPSPPPAPKRLKNDSSNTFCVQARICPESKFPTRADNQSLGLPQSVLPTSHMTPLGAPCAVHFDPSSTFSDLISLVKRTVIYAVGSSCKEVLQGMKSAVIRVVEDGTRVISTFSLSSMEESLMDSLRDKLNALRFASSNSPLMLIVDVPVNDSATSEARGGEDENSNNQSWDDLVYSISSRTNDYYTTERSWKLHAVGSSVGSSSTSRSSGGPKISLNDCFQLFASEEVLGEEDQWYCGECKTHVRASKKIDLWKLPDTLIIHLKRFQYTRGYRNKIESVIDFPIDSDLDMAEFLPAGADKSHTKYSLFGISNHMGSLYSGHYTAYAKLWEDPNSPAKRRKNEWYSFNDSYVSSLNGRSPVADSSNYLLFYQRNTAGN